MKKIVILGAGESGTGAALLAKRQGYEVFVSDLGNIKEEYKKELESNHITFEQGRHSYDQIVQADEVIKSPGIPDDSNLIQELVTRQIPVIDEIEFAFRFHQKGKVVAITGTNGKTTTTLLTHHLLKAAGFNVGMAGNIGKSWARAIAEEEKEVWVLEVSSFQLDHCYEFKPDIGVLINITPDHLDRYNYDLGQYVDSKFRLIQSMDANDHFIYFSDNQLISEKLSVSETQTRRHPVSTSENKSSSAYINSEKLIFTEYGSIDFQNIPLKGTHNMVNTMCAGMAAFILGAEQPRVEKGVKSFKNVAHRMEFIRSYRGVKYYNDSKATNVDATSFALNSFNTPVIWIAGGIDKGNDYSIIEAVVKNKVKHLIAMGKDNSKIVKAFSGMVQIHETGSMKEAIEKSVSLAEKDDTVLLSPACASFDLFKNYEDRGEQFRTYVQNLEKEMQL